MATLDRFIRRKLLYVEFGLENDVAYLVARHEGGGEQRDHQQSCAVRQRVLREAVGWILVRVSENILKCEANDSGAFERFSPAVSQT